MSNTISSRFKLYLAHKSLSQREIASMCGLTPATVSRFCSGKAIQSDKLQQLLNVCDDLSLEYLFFGYGEMFKKDCGTYNIVQGDTIINNSGDSILDKSVSVRNGSGSVGVGAEEDPRKVAELQRIIAQKDKVISERDRMISDLLSRVKG